MPLIDITCRVDILVALLNDQRPRFPAPSEVALPLPSSTSIHIKVAEIASSLAEIHEWTSSCQSTIDILKGLANISLLIQAEFTSKGEDLWKDEVFLGLQINPIAHRLLDLLPTGCFQITTHAILEALRLGMIIWIIWTKQMSQAYPAQTTPYAAKLLNLLLDQSTWQAMLSRPPIARLYFWLIMLCATTTSSTSQRLAALESLTYRLNRMSPVSHQNEMSELRWMPWISGFESLWGSLVEIPDQKVVGD